MANSAQAKKRARQIQVRSVHTGSLRAAMRTTFKKALKAIESGDHAKAQAALKVAVISIDKLVGKGLIQKNAAARYKSRLNAKVKQLQKK